MSIPTTYCGTIYNFTPRPYNVVNQDRNGQTVGVPAADAAGPGIGIFPSTQIFPWCSRGSEIQTYGWVFRSGSTTPGLGSGAFYMFQSLPGTTLRGLRGLRELPQPIPGPTQTPQNREL